MIRDEFFMHLVMNLVPIEPITTHEKLLLLWYESVGTLDFMFKPTIDGIIPENNIKSIIRQLTSNGNIGFERNLTYYNIKQILLQLGVDMRCYYERNIHEIMMDKLGITSFEHISIVEAVFCNDTFMYYHAFNINGKFYMRSHELFYDADGLYRKIVHEQYGAEPIISKFHLTKTYLWQYYDHNNKCKYKLFTVNPSNNLSAPSNICVSIGSDNAYIIPSDKVNHIQKLIDKPKLLNQILKKLNLKTVII